MQKLLGEAVPRRYGSYMSNAAFTWLSCYFGVVIGVITNDEYPTWAVWVIHAVGVTGTVIITSTT